MSITSGNVWASWSARLKKQSTIVTKGRLFLGFALLLSASSLAGIAFMSFVFFSENASLAETFEDVLAQYDGATPTPEDLVQVTHSFCRLDTDIGNVSSFLQPVSETISSGGWCGNYVRVFIELAHNQGYEANMLHLRSGRVSHTAAEIFYEGEWRVVDPFFNLVYPLPDGELATFDDLNEDPSLATTPLSLGGISNPSLERTYRRYEPRFPSLYRDAADFRLELNKSGIYHSGLVMLGYVLDPFYEGGRRAILPRWLDRPEMWGVGVFSIIFLASTGSLVVWRFRAVAARRKSEDVASGVE